MGRGITVCKRWLKFENFLADMGERPEGMTLERKNNDLGYFKRNCRWATRAEQVKNQRKPCHAHMVTLNNRTMCVTDWAKEIGISRQLLLWRLKHKKVLTDGRHKRTNALSEPTHMRMGGETFR